MLPDIRQRHSAAAYVLLGVPNQLRAEAYELLKVQMTQVQAAACESAEIQAQLPAVPHGQPKARWRLAAAVYGRVEAPEAQKQALVACASPQIRERLRARGWPEARRWRPAAEHVSPEVPG